MRLFLIVNTLFSLTVIAHTNETNINENIRQCAKVVEQNKRLTCFDSMAKRHMAELTQESPENRFGLSKESRSELTVITSIIQGSFKGWIRGNIIRLENGQRWQVKGRTKGYINLQSPKVTIKQGLFGSYNMKVEGFTPIAKVKRIQ